MEKIIPQTVGEELIEEEYIPKGECSKCGECCKFLTFTVEGISKSQVHIEYYEAHGCKIQGDTIIVPMRCPQLNEDNTCKIYEDRPYFCRAFKGQTKGYYKPVECTM